MKKVLLSYHKRNRSTSDVAADLSEDETSKEYFSDSGVEAQFGRTRIDNSKRLPQILKDIEETMPVIVDTAVSNVVAVESNFSHAAQNATNAAQQKEDEFIRPKVKHRRNFTTAFTHEYVPQNGSLWTQELQSLATDDDDLSKCETSQDEHPEVASAPAVTKQNKRHSKRGNKNHDRKNNQAPNDNAFLDKIHREAMRLQKAASKNAATIKQIEAPIVQQHPGEKILEVQLHQAPTAHPANNKLAGIINIFVSAFIVYNLVMIIKKIQTVETAREKNDLATFTKEIESLQFSLFMIITVTATLGVHIMSKNRKNRGGALLNLYNIRANNKASDNLMTANAAVKTPTNLITNLKNKIFRR